MREILFKAKRVDNGEWVKGYYIEVKIQYYEDEVSWVNSSDFNKALGHYICDELNRLIEVIPETVCQYTGLNDKNGKKIFEGDIFNLFDACKEIRDTLTIKFDDDMASYEVLTLENYHYSYDTKCVIAGCEVIGSIHDKTK